MKKLINLFFCLFLIFLFVGCSIEKNAKQKFKYNQINNTIYIYDLTEFGKSSEVLFLPRKINNFPVVRAFFLVSGNFIERIYIDAECKIDADFYKEITASKLKYILFLPNTNSVNTDIKDFDIYLEKYIICDISPFKTKYGGKRKHNLNVFNVLYYTEENTLYFADRYDNTKITFLPPKPVKKGYWFKGWFIDKECTTKFNFKKEIIKSPKKDSEEKELLNPLKLYAKWVKK